MTVSPKGYRLALSVKRRLNEAGIGDSPLIRTLSSTLKGYYRKKIVSSPLPIAEVEVNGLAFSIPKRYFEQYIYKEYEPLTSLMFRESLGEGMIMVDVGAHIGYYTLLAASLVGGTGKVYAVEPIEENYKLLEKNIQQNQLSNVEVLPFAAGSIHQKRKFHLTNSSDSHGFYRHPMATTVEELEISEVPLDELITGPVNFVKIDVEGAEIEVLEGMKQLITDSPSLKMMVEWNPECLKNAGHHPLDLPKYLNSKGFKLSLINDKQRQVSPIDEVTTLLQADRLNPAWYANIFAKRA